MNYQKIYNQIIYRAQKEERIKIKGGIYYEKHHIVPKCLGGTNEEDNLVLLTAKEHYFCHKLLTEIFPKNKKLIFAFWAMTILKSPSQDRTSVSSRCYEQIKWKHSKAKSELYKGRTQTPEIIAKRIKGQYGKECKASTRAKISAAAMGHSRNKGWKHSEEAKKRMGASKRGKTIVTKGIPHVLVTCPHCLLEGGLSAMKRWHFENCKFKTLDY